MNPSGALWVRVGLWYHTGSVIPRRAGTTRKKWGLIYWKERCSPSSTHRAFWIYYYWIYQTHTEYRNSQTVFNNTQSFTSTQLNSTHQQPVKRRTQEVSESIKRGKHEDTWWNNKHTMEKKRRKSQEIFREQWGDSEGTVGGHGGLCCTWESRFWRTGQISAAGTSGTQTGQQHRASFVSTRGKSVCFCPHLSAVCSSIASCVRG